MLRDLVIKNRSYRRYQQDRRISRETLVELVDLGRLSASGTNRQPLRYVLVEDVDGCAEVFDTLIWARHLPDWPGPSEGQRPAAYIVMLLDRESAGSAGCDHGIAAQSILLGAVEQGFGGCMLGSINRKALAQILGLEERHEILLVVALGYPDEEVILDPLGPDGDIRYWRDEQDRHHVPKRSLEDIILA